MRVDRIVKAVGLLLTGMTLFAISVRAEVRLPKLVSDGMVLQRDTELTIWGWADEGEQVTLHFRGDTYRTLPGEDGRWAVTLGPMSAGGPYEMTVEGSNRITVSDILVGEVWVSSGQSNMDLQMRRVRPLYARDIAEADYPLIRYFSVPNAYEFSGPRSRLEEGSWTAATPQTVREFSAVSYFFALDIHRRYGVPVGVINASLGGSPAQAWIPEDALQVSFPEYYREAQRFKDTTLVNRIRRSDSERSARWYAQLDRKDRGLGRWHLPSYPDGDWDTMDVPGYWADTGMGAVNGSVWFRKTVNLPEEMAGRSAKLELGRIVDADSVFVNGTFVGNTTYQYPPRWYEVPEGILKEGENLIAIRAINVTGKGGFIPDKPYSLSVRDSVIDLKGRWHYRLGAEMPPLEPQTFIRWKPTGLYNAMIAPLLDYRIQGVIWYQGESNTENPEEYRELFSLMIRTWRDRWQQGPFPFLYVQLANFMKVQPIPSESNWAELREQQRETLALPNTGMAVAIDLGEWNDIHPLRKKEVAERLFLAARKIAYGEELVYSGPMIESMRVENGRAVLEFNHTGSGLEVRGDTLGGFAVAGPDGEFVRASARMEEGEVVVWSDRVDRPERVRYGWADNPESANLYNREGLPASPFEIMEDP